MWKEARDSRQWSAGCACKQKGARSKAGRHACAQGKGRAHLWHGGAQQRLRLQPVDAAVERAEHAALVNVNEKHRAVHRGKQIRRLVAGRRAERGHGSLHAQRDGLRLGRLRRGGDADAGHHEGALCAADREPSPLVEEAAAKQRAIGRRVCSHPTRLASQNDHLSLVQRHPAPFGRDEDAPHDVLARGIRRAP
eukprot:7371948-Prymnesium_polylepis.2